MLRRPLLLLARSELVREAVAASRGVRRFVGGDAVEDAVAATAALAERGMLASVDFLGDGRDDCREVEDVVEAYLELLRRLADGGLGRQAEVAVRLSAIGARGPDHGDKVARDNALIICAAARQAGTAVTLDAEDHASTDLTLQTLHELRKDYPETGVVLQACLRRTEADCRHLAYEGSRVRLRQGSEEPLEVAYCDKAEIDRSFVRCLKILMAGRGYPMVATHDPRLIEIALALAARHGREPGTYELQLVHGLRPRQQERLAEAGETVRVYVPYGREWTGYLLRTLADRPADLPSFLRSLVPTLGR